MFLPCEKLQQPKKMLVENKSNVTLQTQNEIQSTMKNKSTTKKGRTKVIETKTKQSTTKQQISKINCNSLIYRP